MQLSLLILAVANFGLHVYSFTSFDSTTRQRTRDIVSLRAAPRQVIITGANRGIGYECAAKLLQSSVCYNVVLACRSLELGEAAKRRMERTASPSGSSVEVMELDLADLTSVSQFCKNWGDRPLDVLCLNAGIQVGKGVGVGSTTGEEEIRRTKQGFELTVGTNHIGHFALMQALMPNILKTYSSNSGSSEEGPSGRLVIVGSGVHDPDEPGGNVGSKAKLGDMSGLERGFTPPDSMVDGAAFDSDKAYKDSKLCNVVTCLEMARRLSSDSKYKGITCNVMNPGLCPTTGLFRDLNPIFVAIFTLITRYLAKVAVSEEEGGKRLAYMVESPLLDKVTGGYFSGKPGYYEFEATTPSKEARSESTGKRLFDLTEGLVKKYM
jgi:protochlorophyllide reductase